MTVPAESDPYEELEAVRITSIEERRGTVLFMKLAGATFSTIAEHCKVSVATVRKDFDKALAAQAGHWTPERRIARQSAVLTDALRANYPTMMNGEASEKKDATVAILRVLEREAKLFGLDAPQRIIADVNPADFADEAARLINRIVRLDPGELKELTRVGYQPPQRTEQPLDVECEDLGPAVSRWHQGEHSADADWLDTLPETPVDPDPDWSSVGHPARPDSPFAKLAAARGSAAPGTDTLGRSDGRSGESGGRSWPLRHEVAGRADTGRDGAEAPDPVLDNTGDDRAGNSEADGVRAANDPGLAERAVDAEYPAPIAGADRPCAYHSGHTDLDRPIDDLDGWSNI